MKLSSMLATGFGLPRPAGTVVTACGLCGTYAACVQIDTLISSSSAQLADIFRGEYACMDCAACFAESRLLTGNLLAIPGAAIKPVIALQSATDERPAWRNLLRTLEVGLPTVSIITSNTKRRLWPNATVSVFGQTWQPLFVDGDVERLLHIHVGDFLEVLSFVEDVYADGLSKKALTTSLFRERSQLDVRKIMAYETALSVWRGHDEFLLSVFVAQKEEKA